jgi:hypothetical protein
MVSINEYSKIDFICRSYELPYLTYKQMKANNLLIEIFDASVLRKSKIFIRKLYFCISIFLLVNISHFYGRQGK